MDAKKLAARLRDARERAGLRTAAEAAKVLNINTVTYTAHENGTREFDRRAAVLYGNKFGVNPAWLLLGEVAGMPAAGNKNAISEIDVGKDGDEKSTWVLPDDLSKSILRIDPEKACFSVVVGDNMVDPAQPWAPGSIHPGDRVLIDRRDTIPSPPGIFAIHDGVGYSMRILESVPGSDPSAIRISNRNPAYPTVEVEMDKIRIIGRVRGKFSIL